MKSGLWAGLFFLLATDGLAHRLDEYLQATRIAVTTNRIELSINLTPGVAVADRVLAVVDQNRDGEVSDAEVAAYAQLVLNDIRVELDGKVLILNLADTSFPAVEAVKKGLGVISLKAVAPAGPLSAGNHALTLTNQHLPVISVYQVNALAPKDRAIQITKQTRDDLQRSYRLELTASPPP